MLIALTNLRQQHFFYSVFIQWKQEHLTVSKNELTIYVTNTFFGLVTQIVQFFLLTS